MLIRRLSGDSDDDTGVITGSFPETALLEALGQHGLLDATRLSTSGGKYSLFLMCRSFQVSHQLCFSRYSLVGSLDATRFAQHSLTDIHIWYGTAQREPLPIIIS
jgi:hypothetical protein